MLNEFNEGGLHEQNPLGGIPMGQGANGKMNTVEEGETMKNNFIYSNRIKLTPEMISQFNLPKSLTGKTIADATKLINQKFEGRNSKIDNSTKESFLNRIAEAQETIKAEEEAKLAQINEAMSTNSQEVPDMMAGQIPQGMEQFMNAKAPGGFLDFQKNPDNVNMISNAGNILSNIIGPGGTFGKRQVSNEQMGFYDSKLQKDQGIEQGLSQAQDIAATMAGPIGLAVRGGQKVGKAIGDAIGGEGGQAVSSVFDPTTSAISNLSNEDLSIGEKALGVIPGFSGAISGRAARRRADKFAKEKRMSDHFNKYIASAQNFDNVNINALGGNLGGGGDEQEKPKTNVTPATRQDSLQVKQFNEDLLKQLLAEGYVQDPNMYPWNQAAQDNAYKGIQHAQKHNVNRWFINDGKATPRVPNAGEYKVQVDPYRYHQGENATHVINQDFQMPLYDTRITPYGSISLSKMVDGKEDRVNIPTFNFPELSQPKKQPAPKVVEETPVVEETKPVEKPKKFKIRTSGTTVIPRETDTLSKEKLGLNRFYKGVEKDIKYNTPRLSRGGNSYADGGSLYRQPYSTQADDPNRYRPLSTDPVNNVVMESIRSLSKNNPLIDKGSIDNYFNNLKLSDSASLNDVNRNYTGDDPYARRLVNIDPNTIGQNEIIPAGTPNIVGKSNMVNKSQNFGKSPFNMDNIDASILRYSPIAMNAFQLATMGKPETERLDRLNNKYQKQYLDEAALQNIARQQAESSINAIGRSGISGSQLTNAILGSQLNRTKAVSDAYNQIKQHNINEEKMRQQIEFGNNQTNLQQSNMEKDINARNRGAFKTERSKLLGQMGTDFGNIGKEETYKKLVKEAFGYTWDGKYVKNDKGEVVNDPETGKPMTKEQLEKAKNYAQRFNMMGKRQFINLNIPE